MSQNVAPIRSGGLWRPAIVVLMVMGAFLPFGLLFYSTHAPVVSPAGSGYPYQQNSSPDYVPSVPPDWDQVPAPVTPRVVPHRVPDVPVPEAYRDNPYAPRYQSSPPVPHRYSYGSSWHDRYPSPGRDR